MTIIGGIYTGALRLLEPDGHQTGIYKQPASGPVAVSPAGLAGDRQGDPRVHGGPDKAVHHFPAENYGFLKRHAPEAAARFVPGTIGENLSTRGRTEANVCIGDVFRAGSCLLQVTQPRRPCWKIDRRYGIEGLSRVVEANGSAGWYYRVLEPGIIAPGDDFERVETAPDGVTLAEVWQAQREHRPEMALLERIRAARGLAARWRESVERRMEWLRRNAG